MRIRDVAFDTADYTYRTPIKFGGTVVDRVTLLSASVTVEDVAGRVAVGTSSMPLGNVWAFPSGVLAYADTLAAMRAAAGRVADIYGGCRLTGHPIDITHALEPDITGTAAAVTRALGLAEPVPVLAALVAASPFDAALHDAFGKLRGVSVYHLYGRDELPGDLARFLGPAFAGRHLSEFVTPDPRPTLPLYHLVGALDPLTPADVTNPVHDGLPETLGDWVTRDGLTHLKIKLAGDDLAWDLARVRAVHGVAEAAGGVAAYSLDFNEKCRSVDYLLEFLHTLAGSDPAAYARIQYIEQPTARDLAAHPGNRVHAAAALKPVVIDESLTDLASLELAVEMGYTGAAFKACKGQTQSLLLAAAAQARGLFRCVQDLTCPGSSLVHSAGLAAHLPAVAAIEANARQYVPAANAGWDERFPGLFTTTNGTLATGQLTGPGLGA